MPLIFHRVRRRLPARVMPPSMSSAWASRVKPMTIAKGNWRSLVRIPTTPKRSTFARAIALDWTRRNVGPTRAASLKAKKRPFARPCLAPTPLKSSHRPTSKPRSRARTPSPTVLASANPAKQKTIALATRWPKCVRSRSSRPTPPGVRFCAPTIAIAVRTLFAGSATRWKKADCSSPLARQRFALSRSRRDFCWLEMIAQARHAVAADFQR